MTPSRVVPVAKLDQVMKIASDTATAVLGAKTDLHHLSKTVDKLVDVSEKTVELHAKMASYGDRLDRAFNDISGFDSKLTRAIDKLTETLDKDRISSTSIADTVKAYRGGLRTLYVVAGVVGVLVVTLASMTYTQIMAAVERNTSRVEVLEAKNERERIVDNLVVAEHNARLVRLESKGDEVAP